MVLRHGICVAILCLGCLGIKRVLIPLDSRSLPSKRHLVAQMDCFDCLQELFIPLSILFYQVSLTPRSIIFLAFNKLMDFTSFTGITSVVGTRLLSSMAEALQTHEVIPDVVKKVPASVLNVTYPNNIIVQIGKELTPTQVKDQPNVQWEADSNAFYTLCLTGL